MKFSNFYGVVNGYLLKLYCIDTGGMPAAMGSVPSHVTQTPLIKVPHALFTERVTSLRTASAWEAVLQACIQQIFRALCDMH